MGESSRNASSFLITGATGFVGGRLARRLLDDGATVHAIVRNKAALASMACDRLVPHVHNGSSDSLAEIVAQAKPAVTFHLASLFLAEHKPDDVASLVQSNIAFGAQLLEALANQPKSDLTPPARLINTGTSWQHYDDAVYRPVNLYAATKQAFECICQYYIDRGGIDAITLKLFDTYGPGDDRAKLFPMLRRSAETDVTLAMSPGDQLLDLVYIDDVIDAYLAAAELLATPASARHRDYAVSSKSPLPLREIVRIYQEQLGRPLPIHWGARPYRAREVMVCWRAGRSLPNWKPKVDLRDGINRLIAEHASARKAG